jgi:imidazolonepropionase-like amidohydrolase
MSKSIAKMVNLGLRVHIGAHGENPMGHLYHSEMAFTKAGGLTNYQTLQAATSHAAQTLGMWNSIGSLREGKLGDFLVYEPRVDLLEGPIEGTRRIRYIARSGRVWNAETMDEVWPVKRKRKQCGPGFNVD